MVDDWFLEHLAKVTTLSCVLIVIYFLIYSSWRITQMPNYPWNWQWPLSGRNAVEIIRKPTEMPFTLSLIESRKEDRNKCTFILSYLKDREPPTVIVVWGASAPWVLKLVNSPWSDLLEELKVADLQPGEWQSLLEVTSREEGRDMSAVNSLQYFMIHRPRVVHEVENESEAKIEATDPVLQEFYTSTQLVISPPVDFDWDLLKNQYRYPVAVFILNYQEESVDVDHYSINGIAQIIHVKSETFPKASITLAQYIKMNNGQSHLLQSLYVMDDHRLGDDDSEMDDNLEEQQTKSPIQEPFGDILCSVCQVSAVTRVIIPCRHVCLCTQCFQKVDICPICRGTILYYFKTRPDIPTTNNAAGEESQHFTLWQRVERWNEHFSEAMGLTTQ